VCLQWFKKLKQYLIVKILLSLLLAYIAILTSSVVQAQSKAKQSSYDLMSAENKALQDNLDMNPAAFWLLDGQALWTQPSGPKSLSCASCHGDAERSMKGVAASFPKIRSRRLTTLEEQIEICRTERQGLVRAGHESKVSLALSTYVASQSKGLPIHIDDSPAMRAQIDEGAKLFNKRIGQLNLSCAQCHDERAGLKLGGSVIPQAHPSGYPIYRLEWQSVGSLERRLRNCMIGVRSEPFPYDSDELKQLEAFLMWRAEGMILESPAVRP